MALATDSPDAGADGEPLLLSVDFEDWHQLIRRRVGARDWEQPGLALARQTHTLLELFDKLGARDLLHPGDGRALGRRRY
jgi:hypothetical protein